MRSIPKLITAILVSLLAGGIGSIFTASSLGTWYGGLSKPAFNPPSWVFGPVWTTLFILMGIAAFLVWQKLESNPRARTALFIYGGQLVLNVLWSVLFFGMRSPGAAFVEVILFWIAILITIIAFAKVSKTAAWLLVPYLLWVSFASYLNYSIYILN